MKRILLVLSLTICARTTFGAVAHVTANQGLCGNGSHSGNIAAQCTTGTSFVFTFTATTASTDVVFFNVSCGCASTTNVISLSATSWTFNTIACTGATSCTSGTFGTTGNRTANFWAIPPNTSQASITASFSVSVANFGSDLEDEFSGANTTTPVDASTASAAATTCSVNVTPTVANDGLWGACVDSVTAAGSGYTIGANDTSGDQTEWKILTGGSGASQTVNFAGSTGTWEEMAVAIAPAGAATSPTAPSVVY